MSKNAIPRFPQHPNPKPKGKKPKPPKLKSGPTIKPLDVFNVALSADAGTNSSGDSSSTLNHLIKDMSAPQLDKLDKLIQKVQQRKLDSKVELIRNHQTCRRLADTIISRKKNALNKELLLKEKLQKHLNKLKPSHIKFSSTGKVKSLCMDEKKLSVENFVIKYLYLELSLIESLLAEGTLISQRKGQKPMSFLKHMLDEILAK